MGLGRTQSSGTGWTTDFAIQVCVSPLDTEPEALLLLWAAISIVVFKMMYCLAEHILSKQASHLLAIDGTHFLDLDMFSLTAALRGTACLAGSGFQL